MENGQNLHKNVQSLVILMLKLLKIGMNFKKTPIFGNNIRVGVDYMNNPVVKILGDSLYPPRIYMPKGAYTYFTIFTILVHVQHRKHVFSLCCDFKSYQNNIAMQYQVLSNCIQKYV